jgi:hypothetical protein
MFRGVFAVGAPSAALAHAVGTTDSHTPSVPLRARLPQTRTCKKGAHARKESGRRVAGAGRKQPRENLWRRQQRCRGRAWGGSFVQHGPSAVGGSMKVKQAGLDRGSRAQLQKNALLNR